jgi:hypothetical protein
MSTFAQLSTNKGTISSALGKTLAQKVLVEDQTSVLYECIELATYELSKPTSRHIRAGAAKVVEIVAEQKPEFVAPHLEKLMPALSAQEPQTRWMIIRVMGFCAHLNRSAAQEAIPYAEQYIAAKEGLIIASSADLFLGDFGSLSKGDAHRVFPILEHSMETVVSNEQDWLLEALYKLYAHLVKEEQKKVRAFAEHWQVSSRKSTHQRAQRILQLR